MAVLSGCDEAPDVRGDVDGGDLDPDADSTSIVFDAGVAQPTTDAEDLGDFGSDAGAPWQRSPESSAATVRGTLQYERPRVDEVNGVDYSAIELLPIRGVEVQLLRFPGLELIQRTETDEHGTYAFGPILEESVIVAYSAQTSDPPVRVQDSTWDDEVWGGASAALHPFGETVVDLVARTGWVNDQYARRRTAAPFAILDTLYGAGKLISEERNVELTLLKVNWSPKNRPRVGDPAFGDVTATHWDRAKGEMYVLGAADVDTDEFDEHVLVHEWVHYLEASITGRSDNPGGFHDFDLMLDMRLAFSEGLATGLAAYLVGPPWKYVDTFGFGQSQVARAFDVREGLVSVPGWFSEGSCAAVVLNMLLQQGGLGVGLADVLDSMDLQATKPEFQTIFSFLDALKVFAPVADGELTNLLAEQAIDPIMDATGAGETNDGGNPALLPIYRNVALGGSIVELEMTGVQTPNHASQVRFLRFVGEGGTIRLHVNSPFRGDLVIMRDGELVDYREFEQEIAVDMLAPQSSVFVAGVRGFEVDLKSYTVSVGAE